MLSDVTNTTYEDLKREAGDRSILTEEIVINLPFKAVDRNEILAPSPPPRNSYFHFLEKWPT